MYEIKTLKFYTTVRFDKEVNAHLLDKWMLVGEPSYIYDGDEDSGQSIAMIQRIRRNITK
jgi:hypothetical protein